MFVTQLTASLKMPLLISALPSPSPEFCPETDIPAYDASSPWFVMVGETFGIRWKLWLFSSWGEARWLWRIWFKLHAKETRATISSANFTWNYTINSIRQNQILLTWTESLSFSYHTKVLLSVPAVGIHWLSKLQLPSKARDDLFQQCDIVG